MAAVKKKYKRLQTPYTDEIEVEKVNEGAP